MFEMFEKAVLTGLGAISLSQKKAEEFLSELKLKYKVSEEEGRVFLDRIQELSKEGRQRITEITETEVKKVMERTGLVSRVDFDRLQARVEELERRSRSAEPGEPC